MRLQGACDTGCVPCASVQFGAPPLAILVSLGLIVPVLSEYLVEPGPSAVDVMLFIREIIVKEPQLHDVVCLVSRAEVDRAL